MVSVRLWTSPWWVAAHFHQRLLCLGFSLTPYKVSITVCLSWAAHKQNSGRDEAQIPLGCSPRSNTVLQLNAEKWLSVVSKFIVSTTNLTLRLNLTQYLSSSLQNHLPSGRRDEPLTSKQHLIKRSLECQKIWQRGTHYALKCPFMG